LDEDASDLMSMAIYPVPPLDGKGLGVHLTPTTNGNILIGPSAEYIELRENVGNSKAVLDLLKKEAVELLPELKSAIPIKSYAGIRPKLFPADSETRFADFHIQESKNNKNFINLIGIESPGLTSAPAIARYVMEELVGNSNDLEPNCGFNPSRKGIPRSKWMTLEECAGHWQKDHDYGEIICRCNRITRAEIRQAVENPLGTITLNAIKKRTHSMMGRCQGGFCLPKIAAILRDEYGIPPDEIVNSTQESRLFYDEKTD